MGGGCGAGVVGGAMSAADRLKSYVERINRLMDERDALNGDIRDVFQEVKSAGFSPPALRKVIAAMRMDADKRDEIEAMVEMYRAAVGLAKPEAVEMLASGKTIRETNRVTGVALGTLSRRSKTVAKSKMEQDTETDRADYDGVPEGQAAKGASRLPPRPDPISQSPAGAASPQSSATDSDPVVAPPPPSAAPVGDTKDDGLTLPAYLRRTPGQAAAGDTVRRDLVGRA